MTRYKSFGSFLAWYCGPSDEIAALSKAFKLAILQPSVRMQPYMCKKSSDVHAVLKDRYADREKLTLALMKAKAVFLSPAHECQVIESKGWHSRSARKYGSS